MYSDSFEYAVGRLNGTIVRLSNLSPVYVVSCGPSAQHGVTCCVIEIIHIQEGFNEFLDYDPSKEFIIPIDELNLEPVPLGYINLPSGNTCYIVRKPIRRYWRQGLGAGNFDYIGPRRGFNLCDLNDTIQRNYPSFMQAARSKRAETAFSYDFAINPKGEIFYKTTHIGNYDQVFDLLPKYTFLREHLHETIETKLVA